jgi:recombinational DNA repair ATPase RecF
MIKIESIHIEEVRGIRSLDIEFKEGPFAISGPNGSGKSGVIDAIEFGLTGQISRLTGRGTQGLTIAEHGPHVDKTKFPDAAFVEIRVALPALGKTATITRKVSEPKKPKIEPADSDVLAILADVVEHPEIMLSRREILRFILVEPSKRSEEIQTLLKLDEIGETRRTLNSAQNKLQSNQRATSTQEKSSQEALLRHLQVTTLKIEDVLASVNPQRKILGLPELSEITVDTSLDVGLTTSAETSTFNKASALRELSAFEDAAKSFEELGNAELAAVAADIKRLEAEPGLLSALQRLTFAEQGLAFVDGPSCPLCDTEWDDVEHLRTHLQSKLVKSKEAQAIQASLLGNGAKLAAHITKVVDHLKRMHALAMAQGEEAIAKALAAWQAEVDRIRSKLGTVEGIISLKDSLVSGFLAASKEEAGAVKSLSEKTLAKPDQTAALNAQTFLTTAQIRLADYRDAKRKNDAALTAYNAGKATYDIYCEVMETELNTLYDAVQADFSAFYRAINEDDESKFTAKFSPSEGKLDFAVNFYERGLFPPGAYHSEGHQDGMGVCLYLALMKQLFGDKFTFALLDDVVMSVDSGHRYQFCKLLKTYFPNTQFIITTHDRLWAEQMKSAGLVTSKTSLAFHSWTVDTGPLVESSDEIWDEIDGALAKGKAEVAAAALRHHLEYISRLLADQLSASVPFRADGNFELGDLLPQVVHRMRELFGKAADAAQSWGNDHAKQAAGKAKEALALAAKASNVEQWAVNKAVHYNEWANFGKTDFTPVVGAFKELLACFRCATCGSWLYVTPRSNPDSLRCACNEVNFNLKQKPK